MNNLLISSVLALTISAQTTLRIQNPQKLIKEIGSIGANLSIELANFGHL